MYRRPLEVWRRDEADVDAGGGRSSTFERVLGTPEDPLLGKVDQPDAREQNEAAQAGITLTHVIYFAGVVDVRRGDQLRDPDDPARADDEPYAGDIFDVESVVRPSTPRYTRCNVELTQTEGD